MARRLQQKGHKIRIVAFTDDQPYSEDLETIPVRIKYPILGTLLRQIKLLSTLLSAVKGMDLIYMQDPMVVGVASLLVGKLTGKPLVLKFVGDSVWEKEFSFRRTDEYLDDFLKLPPKSLLLRFRISLLKFVFGRMSRIIVPSFYLRDMLIRHYGVKSGKVAVVYNSVDSKSIEKIKRGRREKEGTKIITVGRIVRHKRMGDIITALHKLSLKFPDINLTVVGDGPEKAELERLVERMGMVQQVQFCGSINHNETLELLKTADVFVLNSTYEGLPHTVIEAMACSVPVIATGIRGTDEVIDDGRTGLLLPLDDEQVLVYAIAKLLEDKKLAERLAEQALAVVSEKFSWDNNLVKLEAELEKVI
ncbi:MAG TPA: glycosyltransferase family 4 protein [Dehalococcoidia bacterium]|nr:glycosyltransferase family 4 protein [Dehalococcoidia bacterium]